MTSHSAYRVPICFSEVFQSRSLLKISLIIQALKNKQNTSQQNLI